MSLQNKIARLAGLLYLILIICGIFNLMYIPSKFIVWNNASKTLENIIHSEMIFRLGIVGGIITFLAFLILPLVLYWLLKPVNRTAALLMVIFAVISVPISFANILHKFSVLTLLSKADYLKLLDTSELQFQVMFHLQSFNNGIQLSQIFWGLWLFPFGYLVFKSGFLPKILGVFLMAGCIGYLIEFFGGFLFENSYYETLLATIAGIPASVGELGICIWLLIMGTNKIRFKKNYNKS